MTNAYIEHPEQPQNAQFAKALAKFQADLPNVALDAVNPHFKSKFTSLKELTSKVLPALVKVGLAYTAGSRVDEAGRMVVTAKLIHTSGEYESAEFPITDTNPQKVGSALSYARRYLLASLTGVVADVDDDGNAASNPTPVERQLDKARDKPSNKPAPKKPSPKGDQPKDVIRRDWIDAGKVASDTVNKMFDAEKANGLSGDALFARILSRLEEGDVE